MRLFCFPYAGASSLIYSGWRKFISNDIEICAIELAGRGRRVMEKHYGELDDVISDIIPLLKKDILSGVQYSFFGHSLGARIAYELTMKIQEDNLRPPEHIFFSGAGAPHIGASDEKQRHLLSDEKFLEELKTLGGTPLEFFETNDLVTFFLPLLKNDFKLAESKWELRGTLPLMQCNISILAGLNENLTAEQIQGWADHTSGRCSIHYFKGDHFFINHFTREIVYLVNRTLKSLNS